MKFGIEKKKRVVFSYYYSGSVGTKVVTVFRGSEKDCLSFVKAQAIDMKASLENVSEFMGVKRASNWARVELIDDNMNYYSSTYAIC